jgi:hypothetical protein
MTDINFSDKNVLNRLYILLQEFLLFLYSVFLNFENLIKRFQFNIHAKDICCSYNFDFASEIKLSASKVCYKF